MMKISQHTVLEHNNLLESLEVLKGGIQQSTILIVCCSRRSFEIWLHLELENAVQHDLKDDMEDIVPPPSRTFHAQHILRTIKALDTVQLVFCFDVAHLRAYLSSMLCDAQNDKSTEANEQNRSLSILAVLNPIQVHHVSMAYSAREINRTLASIIDSADHTNRYAILFEHQLPDELSSTALRPKLAYDTAETDPVSQSISWNDDVGIVDAKTRTFGPGASGWTGRTIKLRQIAQRWFVFAENSSQNDGTA